VEGTPHLAEGVAHDLGDVEGTPPPPTHVGNEYSRIPVAQPQEYEYAYSAWFTLYMTCIRTYLRLMYSQNG